MGSTGASDGMAEALEHLHDHVPDDAQMLGVFRKGLRQPVDLGKLASPGVGSRATGRLERRLHAGADSEGEVKVERRARLQVYGKTQFALFRVPASR